MKILAVLFKLILINLFCSFNGASSMEILSLTLDDLFAVGGNRCCFSHPDNPHLCIKINRRDHSPEHKKAQARFLKRFRPLSSFDENREEKQVLDRLNRQFPEAVGQMIPKSDDWIETNYGKGLVSSLFRNASGEISSSLEAEILFNGLTSEIKQAIAQFSEKWLEAMIPSRQLLLHNILVVRKQASINLVVIDGLGAGETIPFDSFFPAVKKRRMQNKIFKFQSRIDLLHTKIQSGDSNTLKWAHHRADPMNLEFKKKVLGLLP